jgi:hypothetical protein
MNYSENFNRDYEFYLKNIDNFKFCGTHTPKFKAVFDEKGNSAKEVFYNIDTYGKNIPTNEPELLDDLLLCKASVNFQIKQWAEARAEGTLSLSEFCGTGETPVLEWKIVNNEAVPIYHTSIVAQYNLPDWVVKAVESQKAKFYKTNTN